MGVLGLGEFAAYVLSLAAADPGAAAAAWSGQCFSWMVLSRWLYQGGGRLSCLCQGGRGSRRLSGAKAGDAQCASDGSRVYQEKLRPDLGWQLDSPVGDPVAVIVGLGWSLSFGCASLTLPFFLAVGRLSRSAGHISCIQPDTSVLCF